LWPARLFTLYAADQKGAREPLLAYADLLLPEPQLREMVTGIERDLDNSPTARRRRAASASRSAGVPLNSGALSRP